MILSRFRRANQSPLIPYDMFDIDGGPADLRRREVMEGIYHKGQSKAWNGKEVLAELLEKHGGINLTPEQLHPMRNIFSVIFWGEMAAWKVSAELALELEPLEARMAATSQAHDEARHFYVLHDYLELIGYTPGELPKTATRVLAEVVGAKTLARKLMGMQLMVEPIALTLFQIVRERQLEPVLADLLKLFEMDEARHIALGVQYLPMLIEQMSQAERLAMWAWQIRMLRLQLDGLKEIEPDLRALGVSPREMLRLGLAKQLHAGEQMLANLPDAAKVAPVFERIVEFWMELDFPEEGHHVAFPTRLRRALRGAVLGPSERVDPGHVVAA
jgi:hypothetical protein